MQRDRGRRRFAARTFANPSRSRAHRSRSSTSLNLALVTGSDNHGWGRAAPGVDADAHSGLARHDRATRSRRASKKCCASAARTRRESPSVAWLNRRRRSRSHWPAPVDRVAHAHDALRRRARDVDRLDLGDLLLAAIVRRRRRTPPDCGGVTNESDARRDARWRRARLDRHRGGRGPPRLRRRAFPFSLTKRTTGNGRDISRRLLRSSARGRAAHSLRRRRSSFGAATPIGIRLGVDHSGWIASLSTICHRSATRRRRCASRSAPRSS